MEVKLLVSPKKYKMHRLFRNYYTFQNDSDILSAKNISSLQTWKTMKNLWYLLVRIPGYCIIQYSLLHKQRILRVKHLKQYAFASSTQMGCQHRLLELVHIVYFRSLAPLVHNKHLRLTKDVILRPFLIQCIAVTTNIYLTRSYFHSSTIIRLHPVDSTKTNMNITTFPK